MKRKFVKSLKRKDGLPLAVYLLENDGNPPETQRGDFWKYDTAGKINSKGYELLNYYKVISKF